MSRICESRSDFDIVIKVFQAVVDKFESGHFQIPGAPNSGWPWDRLGAAYSAKGQYESAFEAYEKTNSGEKSCW